MELKTVLSSIQMKDPFGFVDSIVSTSQSFPKTTLNVSSRDMLRPFPEGSFTCDSTTIHLTATTPVLGLELKGRHGIYKGLDISGVTYTSIDTKDIEGLYISLSDSIKSLIHGRIFSILGNENLLYLLGEWAEDANSGSIVGIQLVNPINSSSSLNPSSSLNQTSSLNQSLLDFHPSTLSTSTYSLFPLPEFKPKPDHGSNFYFLSATALPDLFLQRASFSVCATVSMSTSCGEMAAISTERFGIGADSTGRICAWLRKPQGMSELTPTFEPWWTPNSNTLLLVSSVISSLSTHYFVVCIKVDLQSQIFSFEVDGVMSEMSIPIDFLQFAASFNTSQTLFIGVDSEIAVIKLDPPFDIKSNPHASLSNDSYLTSSRSPTSEINARQGLGILGNASSKCHLRPSRDRLWCGSVTDVALFSGCVPSTVSQLIAWYPLRGEESLTVDASGGGRDAVLRMASLKSCDTNDSNQKETLSAPFLHISDLGAPFSPYLSSYRGIGTGWTSFAIPSKSTISTSSSLPSLLFSGHTSVSISNDSQSLPHFQNQSFSPMSGASVWLRESQNVLGGFETAFSIEIPNPSQKRITATRLTFHGASGTWNAGALDFFGIPSILASNQQNKNDSLYSDWITSALKSAINFKDSCNVTNDIDLLSFLGGHSFQSNVAEKEVGNQNVDEPVFEFPVQFPTVPRMSSSANTSSASSGALFSVQISFCDSSLVVSLVSLSSSAIEKALKSSARMLKESKKVKEDAVLSSNELSTDALEAMLILNDANKPILLHEAIGAAYIENDVNAVMPENHTSSSSSTFSLPTSDSLLPRMEPIMEPVPTLTSSAKNLARLIAQASIPTSEFQNRITVNIQFDPLSALLHVSINGRTCLSTSIDLSSTLGLTATTDKVMVSLGIVGQSSSESPLLLVPLDSNTLILPIKSGAILHRWAFNGHKCDESKNNEGESCVLCGMDSSTKTIPIVALVVNDLTQNSYKPRYDSGDIGPKIWTFDGKCNKAKDPADADPSDNDSVGVAGFFSSAEDEEAAFNDNDDMPTLVRTDLEEPFVRQDFGLSEKGSQSQLDSDKISCGTCTFDNPKNASRCEICNTALMKNPSSKNSQSRIEPFQSGRSHVADVIPKYISEGSKVGSSHSIMNSPVRNSRNSLTEEIWDEKLVSEVAKMDHKKANRPSPTNLRLDIASCNSNTSLAIEPVLSEEEEIARAIALSLDPSSPTNLSPQDTIPALALNVAAPSIASEVSTMSTKGDTSREEGKEKIGKSSKKPLSPRSVKSSPRAVPRPPLVSKLLTTAASDLRSPSVQNLLHVLGDWNLNVGHMSLTDSSSLVTTEKNISQTQANIEIQYGYLINGRFGYATPLTIPPAVVSEAGLCVPSAFASTTDASCTAQIVSESLGPRDGSTRLTQRGRMSLVSFANLKPIGADYKWSWRFFGCLTFDNYSFAATSVENIVQVDDNNRTKVLRPVLSTSTPSTLTLTLSSDGLRLGGQSRNLIPLGASLKTGKWVAIKNSIEDLLRLKCGNGYSGLVNMDSGLTNACYANSLIQSFTLTDEIRYILLSSPLVPLELPFDGQTIHNEELMTSSSLYGLFQHDDVMAIGSIEDEPGALVIRGESGTSSWSKLRGTEDARRRAVANRLQWLVARLSYSQRPKQGIWAIKRLLFANFRSNSQQDVVEFSSSLIDDVDLAWTSPQNLFSRKDNSISSLNDGLFESVFGGLSATLKSCLGNIPANLLSSPSSSLSFSSPERVCGHGKTELLPMSSLIVQMRGFLFEPIVSIIVVVLPGSKAGGSSSPAVVLPPGYERLDGPSISNDPGNAHVFLAVLRDPTGLSFEPNTSNDVLSTSSTSVRVRDFEPDSLGASISSMSQNSLTSRTSTPRSVLKPITEIKLFTVPRPHADMSGINFRLIKDVATDPSLSWNPVVEPFTIPLVAYNEGYTVIPTNLRCSNSYEERLYIGYKRVPSGSPITSLQLASPSQDIEPEGHVSLHQNLYSSSSINTKTCYLYVKRDMPIHDIAIRPVPTMSSSNTELREDLQDGWIPTQANLSQFSLASTAAGFYHFDTVSSPSTSLLPAISLRDSAGDSRICYSKSVISSLSPITDIICVPHPKGRAVISSHVTAQVSPKSYLSSVLSLLTSSSSSDTITTSPTLVLPPMLGSEALRHLASGKFPHLLPFAKSGWELLQSQPIESAPILSSSVENVTNDVEIAAHILVKRGDGHPLIWMDAFRGANCLAGGIRKYEREGDYSSSSTSSSSSSSSFLSSSLAGTSFNGASGSGSGSTGGLGGGKSNPGQEYTSSASCVASALSTNAPLLGQRGTDEGKKANEGMIDNNTLGDIEVLDVAPSHSALAQTNHPPPLLGSWEMPWHMRQQIAHPNSISLSIEAQSTAPSVGYIVDGSCGIGTRISGILVQSHLSSEERRKSKTEDETENDTYVLFGMYSCLYESKRWAHVEAIITIPISMSPTSRQRLPPPTRISGVFYDTCEYNNIQSCTTFESERIGEECGHFIENIGAPIVDICLVRGSEAAPQGYTKILQTKCKQTVKSSSQDLLVSGSLNSRVGNTPPVIPVPTTTEASLHPPKKVPFQAMSTPIVQAIAHEGLYLCVKRSWGELLPSNEKATKRRAQGVVDFYSPIVDVCVLSLSFGSDLSEITVLDNLQDNLQDLSPSLERYSIVRSSSGEYVDLTLSSSSTISTTSSITSSTTRTSVIPSNSSSRIGMFLAIKRASRIVTPDLSAETSLLGSSSSSVPISTSPSLSEDITSSLKSSLKWPYVERNLLLDIEVLLSDPVDYDIVPRGFKKITKTVPPPLPALIVPLQPFKTSKSLVSLVSLDANLNTGGVNTGVKTHLAVQIGSPQLPFGPLCPKSISGSYTVKHIPQSEFSSALVGQILNLRIRGPIPITALKGSMASNSHSSVSSRSFTFSGGTTDLVNLSNKTLSHFDTRSSNSPITTTEIFRTFIDPSLSKSHLKGLPVRGVYLKPREAVGVAIPASSAIHLLHAVETGVLALSGVCDSLHVSPEDDAWYTLGIWKDDSETTSYVNPGHKTASKFSAMFEMVFLRSSSTLGPGAALSRTNISLNPFQQPMVEAVGSISIPLNSSPFFFWKLHAQHVLRIVWRRDLSSLYRNGELVQSARLQKLELNQMIVSQTKSVNSSAQCEGCGNRAPFSSSYIVASPPRHLLVNMMRMFYNKKIGSASKVHSYVDVPLELQLPATSTINLEAIQQAIELANSANTSSDEKSKPSSALHLPLAQGKTLYGLYSIIVHKGGSANSGHYYCFARRSRADLTKSDDLSAPWMLFDDDRVSTTSWDAIKKHLSSSVTESAYALFYRRLDIVQDDKQTEPQLASWVNAVAADNYNLLRKIASSTSNEFTNAYESILEK